MKYMNSQKKLFLFFFFLLSACIFCACNNKGGLGDPVVTYYWYNADGKEYHKENVQKGEQVKNPSLPSDTDKWDYIEWEKKTDTTFYAVREPKVTYFQGNVFQIIIKDLGGNPVSTGSGFVFNRDGWFVTNAHVMKGAYFADAVFNIPNEEEGESYTYLDITMGTYYNANKDIYIGQIKNYSSIIQHYKEIPIETSYSQGDVSYSVGYPQSSVELKLNKGVVTENWADLYEKLYSGNTYICSSAYIAPGSSGGILVDDELRVIGITTLGWTNDEDKFISGASISAFNFKNTLENTNEDELLHVSIRFHADESDFIMYFLRGIDDHRKGKAEMTTANNGATSIIYEWKNTGTLSGGGYYEENYTKIVASNGFIGLTLDVYFSAGGRLEVILLGTYDPVKEIDDFSFSYKFYYNNSKWYGLVSDNVNYSTNYSLSLNSYYTDKSYGYTITSEDILDAKEFFNRFYMQLLNDLHDVTRLP